MSLNKIGVDGIVRIKNGCNEIKTSNHILNNGIKHFYAWIINYRDSGSDWDPFTLSSWHCEIGNGTSTITTSDMSSLVAVISSGEDSSSGSLGSGVDYFEVTYHFTWNSGSVTGTLGECGLFLSCFSYITFGELGSRYNPTESLFSRLSSADGDFSSFVIDDTVPLTIDWTLRFEFV